MPMSNNSSAAASGQAQVVEVEDTGVMWSAIIGGTIAASAFFLLLAPLGSGLGLLKTSPWGTGDLKSEAFTMISAIWLIVMQWVASGVGGYLTGRLRTEWSAAHTHEVFFRDTAHGFLTWALTNVVGVILLTAGIMHATEHHPSLSGPPAMASVFYESPEAFAVSKLFRTDQATANVTEQDRADSLMVLMQATDNGKIPDADKAYLDQVVAARTGLGAADSTKRVDDVITQLRDSQKAIHKTMAVAGLFIFLSLWVGVFIASAAGALGGQHRDSHYKTGKLAG